MTVPAGLKLESDWWPTAPEILASQPYTEKVDTWSLGVIVYVLLCGSLPFYSDNELEISELITACTYDLGDTDARWRSVSAEAKHLVKALLTKDWRRRLSAEQVLRHPFVTRTSLNKAAAATATATAQVASKPSEIGAANDVRSPTSATAMLRAKWPKMAKMNKFKGKWPSKFRNMLPSAESLLRSPSPSRGAVSDVSEVETEHSAAE